MTNEDSDLIYVKAQSVRAHGGSLELTIPSEILEFLDVGERDNVAFLKDEKHGIVILLNSKRAEGLIPGFGKFRFGFSISKELMEKLLDKKQ